MTHPFGHGTGPDFVDSQQPLDGARSQEQPQSTQPAPSGSSQAPHQPTPQPSLGTGLVPAEHPKAMTVLILGLLGFVFWIPGIVGWLMASGAKKENQRGGTPYAWDGALRAGHLLSVISTVLYGVMVASFVLMVMLIVAATM